MNAPLPVCVTLKRGTSEHYRMIVDNLLRCTHELPGIDIRAILTAGPGMSRDQLISLEYVGALIRELGQDQRCENARLAREVQS